MYYLLKCLRFNYLREQLLTAYLFTCLLPQLKAAKKDFKDSIEQQFSTWGTQASQQVHRMSNFTDNF